MTYGYTPPGGGPEQVYLTYLEAKRASHQHGGGTLRYITADGAPPDATVAAS